jgi:hypothetical protein
MMREIRIHDDYEISGNELEPVNIGGSEAELAGARLEQDLVRTVHADQLLCDLLRAIGRGVVNDDEFPLEVTMIPWEVST